jgi:hypothetical protein
MAAAAEQHSEHRAVEWKLKIKENFHTFIKIRKRHTTKDLKGYVHSSLR